MNDYYNHYDESKKITLKHIFTQWFKFFRLLIIITIGIFLYQLLGSDVRKCSVVGSNGKTTITNCGAEIIEFDNEKLDSKVRLEYGDSVNVYIGKINSKVRKVKLNYTLLEE